MPFFDKVTDRHRRDRLHKPLCSSLHLSRMVAVDEHFRREPARKRELPRLGLCRLQTQIGGERRIYDNAMRLKIFILAAR